MACRFCLAACLLLMQRFFVVMLGVFFLANHANAETVQETDSPGVARVVLIRSMDNKISGAVNVFYGDRFHAALQPNEYTVLDLCLSNPTYSVGSLETLAEMSEINRHQVIEKYERMVAGQQRFYLLSLHELGVVNIQPMASSSIDWAVLKEQRRTVSRVSQRCDEKPIAPSVSVAESTSVVVPAKSITLSVSAELTFPFASYTLNDASGSVHIQQRLQALLDKAGIRTIEHVVVKGHSDSVGQPHRKERVSGERARVVAAYIGQQFQVPASRIVFQTISDREPLVVDCPTVPVVARDVCNSPNRRVEIMITGGQ